LDEEQPLKFNYQQASRIISKFLLEGKLNPAIFPTETGFRHIFSAWIPDDDLPWTTGQSPMLASLFRCLKVNYMLQSDTAVWGCSLSEVGIDDFFVTWSLLATSKGWLHSDVVNGHGNVIGVVCKYDLDKVVIGMLAPWVIQEVFQIDNKVAVFPTEGS
jgi:hypothetical protein